MTPSHPLVDLMAHAGPRFPTVLHQALVREGSAIVPAVLRLLEDDAFAHEDSPGQGWGPIYAARLLGELRPPEAIEPMLERFLRTRPDEILLGELSAALRGFGPAAFEPAWARYERAEDENARRRLLQVLAHLGVRDDRLRRALVQCFGRNTVLGALLLGDYGDSSVLPILERAFLDQPVADPKSVPLGNQALVELRESILLLGGELTPAMEAKMALVDAKRDAMLAEHLPERAQPVRRESEKVGRNEPCPCGSGKKYKKCHGA